MTPETGVSRTNWLLENENLVNDLKKSRLLKNVSDQFFMEMINISEVINFPSDSVIIREGQFNKYLYFLLQGKVSLLIGSELIMEMSRIGDVFGEINTVNETVFFLSAVAKSSLVLLRLDLVELENSDNKISDNFLAICNEIINLSLIDKIRILIHRSKNYTLIQNQLRETRSLLNTIKRKSSSEEELKAEELLDTLPDLLIYLDQEGTIKRINPSSNPRLQYEFENFVGKNFTEVEELPPSLRELGMNTLINAMETHEDQQVDFHLEIAETEVTFEARVIVTDKQEVLILIREYPIR